MAIPDSLNFSLADVQLELLNISGNNTRISLEDMFTEAYEYSNNQLFDPAYMGNLDRLSNFRNYNSIPPEWVAVIAPSNISTSVWSNVTTQSVGSGILVPDYLKGKQYTDMITSQSGHTTSAALLCTNYSSEGNSDWHLMSRYDAGMISANKSIINAGLINNYGFPAQISGNYYNWLSDESNNISAWSIVWNGNSEFIRSKSSSYVARPVSLVGVPDSSIYDIGDKAFGGIVFNKGVV